MSGTNEAAEYANLDADHDAIDATRAANDSLASSLGLTYRSFEAYKIEMGEIGGDGSRAETLYGCDGIHHAESMVTVWNEVVDGTVQPIGGRHLYENIIGACDGTCETEKNVKGMFSYLF